MDEETISEIEHKSHVHSYLGNLTINLRDDYEISNFYSGDNKLPMITGWSGSSIFEQIDRTLTLHVKNDLRIPKLYYDGLPNNEFFNGKRYLNDVENMKIIIPEYYFLMKNNPDDGTMNYRKNPNIDQIVFNLDRITSVTLNCTDSMKWQRYLLYHS